MSGRNILVSFILLFAAACVGCLSTLPLIWDGGYQFTVSLIQQEPYCYLTRFHTHFLWAPLVWLSARTDDLNALLLAYGLPFLAAPAASVAISWWVARQHAPRLAIWPLFGIAASLPGQAFVINDSIWQQTIFWPVLLGALVPLDWKKRVVLLAVAAFQFPHQVGTIFLAIAAVAAALVAWRNPAGRREAMGKMLVLGVLTLLAVAKTIWVSVPAWSGRFYDSYAAQQASMGEAITCFVVGVCHFPIVGLICLWLVAWGISRSDSALTSKSWWLVAIAGIAWVIWASVPTFWCSAIFYRRWVLPMAFPFYCFTVLDALRKPDSKTVPGSRGNLATALAGIFAAVLVIQSVQWRQCVSDLFDQADARQSPVVTKAELPCLNPSWLDGHSSSGIFAMLQQVLPARSPLDHWGITATFMVLQGRQPPRYLAYDEECLRQITARQPSVPLCAQHPVAPAPGTAGYYDHRPLLLQIAGKRGAP